MKKLFYVLFASAALSFVACKSGGDKTEAVDSTEVSNMVEEATMAVDSAANAAVDTAKQMIDAAADSAKKM
jgi:hypothetical protein